VPALDVVEVRTLDGLIRHEREWNEALEASNVRHPFLTHEWVRTWLESFDGEGRPRVLFLRDGDRTVAVAPFVERRRKLYGVQARCLELMWNEHVQRSGLILAAPVEPVLAALWDAMRRLGGWDLLHLTQVPEATPELDAFRRYAARDGLAVGAWESSHSPYVPLAGGWDAYWSRISKDRRRKLRQKENRLERKGALTLEIVEDGPELDEALAEGYRIEGAAWKAGAGTAIRCDPRTEKLYTGFARRAAARGWNRQVFLRVGDRRIAWFYAVEYAGRFFVLKTGYDPRYRPYAPGMVLHKMMIRRAYERGLEEFDFLGDSADWKLDWTDVVRRHTWLWVFDRGLRARWIHAAKFHLAPRLGRSRVLRRLGRGIGRVEA